MDQSYVRFLFRLAGKSKQSGLSKPEKVWLKGVQLHTQIAVPGLSSFDRFLRNKLLIILQLFSSSVLRAGSKA